MNPSRINALINLHVFKDPEVYEARIGMSGLGPRWSTKEEAERLVQKYKEEHLDWESYLEKPFVTLSHSNPQYSSDPGAAMEVVRQLTNRDNFEADLKYGFIFRLEGTYDYKWEATFFHPFAGSPADPGSFAYFQAEHEDPCMAICLAALELVGVDPKEQT